MLNSLFQMLGSIRRWRSRVCKAQSCDLVSISHNVNAQATRRGSSLRSRRSGYTSSLLGVLCLLGSSAGWTDSPSAEDASSQEVPMRPGETPIDVAAEKAGVSYSVQSRPVWEFGIGGGYFSGFDYPASNDSNRRAIALPFFIYRGPQLRFGGGGVRAVAIEQPRVRLDLSLGGSLNASSGGNSARDGMPDLDFLFEIGPQLEVGLYEKSMPEGGRLQVRFSSELRAVMSTDFRRLDQRGVVVEAGLGVNYRNFRNTGVDLLAAFQSTYGSERLQDYFYEVAPEYANVQRPAFDAQAGYLESGVFAGIGLTPLRNLRVFIGVFTGWFEGARNRDSPLFETNSSTGFAVGLAWSIRQSDSTVDVVELGSNS